LLLLLQLLLLLLLQQLLLLLLQLLLVLESLCICELKPLLCAPVACPIQHIAIPPP
jgi:hypothetical protein